MYYYQAFQLPVLSELKFPELLSTSKPPCIDSAVTIKWGKVDAEGLPSATACGLYYQAKEAELWLNIPNVARFLIKNGSEIIIHPTETIDETSLRVFVLGSCMGALLMQRNLFLLHGNAIKIGDSGVAFVGQSGAGKSTLSAAFFKQGYPILADDICAINTKGEITPSFPQIKLWQDAALALGIETSSLRKIRPSIEKFGVPLSDQFHKDPLPLKVIYILCSHNKDEFCFETIDGVQKLKPIKNNTYRQLYAKGLKKEKIYFLQSANIANHTHIVRILRPSEGFKLNELTDLIKQDLIARGLSDERF
jgi:hypothetical protein